MATKLELISQAMLLIGENPVSDLNETTSAALIASNLYDLVYEDCLAADEWNFATTRFSLSRLEETPPTSPYKYQYQLPSDYLRALAVDRGGDYEINGDKLLSDEPEIILEYVYRAKETKLPPWFAQFVVYALAKAFAVPVTQKTQLLEAYASLAQSQMDKARFIDSTTAPLDGWSQSSDLGFTGGSSRF